MSIIENSENRQISPPKTSESIPADVQDLLRKVDTFLKRDEIDGALALLSRARLKSAWLINATGVCQLRLRNYKVAVDVFRGLVLGSGGLVLRSDVPRAFLVNYATALLAAGNVGGAHRVLNELDEESSPAVQRLRRVRQEWLKSLTIWQKLNVWAGGQPALPIELDFPAGELGLYSAS